MFRQCVNRTCRHQLGRGFFVRFNSTKGGSSSSSSAPLFSRFSTAAVGAAAGTVLATVYFNSKNGASVKQQQSTSTSSSLPLADLVKPEYASHEAQQIAFNEIEKLVGSKNISKNKSELDNHSDTYWTTHHAKEDERPAIIVYPKDTQEVSEIMKIAHRYRVPVVPFSGGTSLEGHFLPTFGGVCIDFSQMDQILEFHKDDLDVVVQPGLGWEALNDYLSDDGLFFAPDPGPGAQIGGMIGTSCSGTNAGRYGTMKENVVNLTVVLADGTVIKTRQRPRKSSAGYNLTQLFIGSEGTLGLVTEATLKLTPRPQQESVGVVTFPTIAKAADAVRDVVQQGLIVGAVELLDDVALRAINQAGTTERTWQEMPTLFFKFSGTQTSVDDQIHTVREIAAKYGSKSFEFAKDADEREALWAARKHALWSVIEAAPKGSICWTTDVAVPISRLPEIVAHSKQDMIDNNIKGGIVGHVLDGNYHCLIPHMPEDHQKVSDLVDRMVHKAIEFEGTATGEHGIGVGKKKYLESEVGETSINVMRQLKKSLDPLCILNPDKVITMNPFK